MIAQSIIDKSTITSGSSHPIFKYINSLGATTLQFLLMQLYTGQEVSQIDELFFDLAYYLLDKNLETSSTTDYLDKDVNKDISVSLKDDLVIPVAWNRDRFINAFTEIGTNYGNPFKYYSINHMSKLLLPIGVTIVYNGNYSTLSGVLQKEGSIQPTEIIDLSSRYNNIDFDGTYYRESKTKRIVQKVKHFEMGAIYEIGRLIKNTNICFLDQSKL
jgi:hypothetical protein